jgi:mevalonate kinase
MGVTQSEKRFSRSAGAKGKIILFGEHAAVYGFPALGLQLAEELTVTLVIAGAEPAEKQLRCSCGPAAEQRLRRLIEELGTAEHSLFRRAAELSVQSALPPGLGFGSSAALCAALAKLSLAEGAAAEEIWREAHRLERAFHGTPSGIDTGLSLQKGTTLFFPRPPALPEFRRLPDFPAHLLVGAVPRTSGTAELVAGIAAERKKKASAVTRLLTALGEESSRAAQLIEHSSRPDQGKGDAFAQLLGACADRSQEMLAELGLSTAELDFCLQAAKEGGAAGAKLSGAGGGGAFYAVAGSRGELERAHRHVARSCSRKGVPLLFLKKYPADGAA